MNAEEQENQAHQGMAKEDYPTPQLDLRWKKMHCLENDENWERIGELRGCCLEQKEKRNSQGKDPKTSQENSHGRDPNTLERNSQGEDPRTFEESVKKVEGSEEAKGKEVEEKGEECKEEKVKY